MERLTYRDNNGMAVLTLFGKQIYCSTQATADCFCKFEEHFEPKLAKIIEITDSDGGKTKWWYCPECYATLNQADNFCHDCGQAVKWEEPPKEG